MKLLESAKAIETAITSISTRGKKLDMDIQIAGCSIIQHIQKHGDVTLANKLYTCMPAGSRRRALAEWLMVYAIVGPNMDRASAKESPFIYDKTKKGDAAAEAEKLQAAIMEPWFNFAPEPEVIEMFDVRKSLHMLLAKAKKAPKVNDMGLLMRLQQIEDALPPDAVDAKPATAAATH